MVKTIKLTATGILRLESIKAQLKRSGVSLLCPLWREIVRIDINSFLEKNESAYLSKIPRLSGISCKICAALFPRLGKYNGECPCYIYNTDYLIKRIDEILEANK